jgi:hypothetical protein
VAARKSGRLRPAFRGARKFVSEQRSHERVHVDRSVGNMRDTVRAFARALTTMVSEERTADEQLGAQVGRLVSACQLNEWPRSDSCWAPSRAS